MAENINFNKTVYKKRNYQKTIDTSFKELGVKTIQEQIDEQPTVQEFFDLYNELFYEIEANGDNNTHEFLVKTSGEYINFDQESDMVKALQEEITALRQENLDLQIDVLKAKTGEDIALTSSIDIDINNSKDSQKELFNNLGLNNITGI